MFFDKRNIFFSSKECYKFHWCHPPHHHGHQEDCDEWWCGRGLLILTTKPEEEKKCDASCDSPSLCSLSSWCCSSLDILWTWSSQLGQISRLYTAANMKNMMQNENVLLDPNSEELCLPGLEDVHTQTFFLGGDYPLEAPRWSSWYAWWWPEWLSKNIIIMMMTRMVVQKYDHHDDDQDGCQAKRCKKSSAASTQSFLSDTLRHRSSLSSLSSSQSSIIEMVRAWKNKCTNKSVLSSVNIVSTIVILTF